MESFSEPPAKKVKTLDTSLCIICKKKLYSKDNSEPVVKNPTIEGLNSILKYADQKKDDVFELLSPHKEAVLSKKIQVSFHKSCRAKYTSKTNLMHVMKPYEDVSQKNEQLPSVRESSRRSGSVAFDIRKNCFICGDGSRRKHELTPITTGTGESTRKKVLDAATERQDNIVYTRMLAFTDLFAYDAKYNRQCYSHYISERNIKAARKRIQDDSSGMTVYDKAFNSIVQKIQMEVISQENAVTTLAAILYQYKQQISVEGDVKSVDCRSSKLKEKLKKHFGDRLVFVERRGLSDIVCTGKITVEDALKKALLLEDKLKKNEDFVEYEEISTHFEENEIEILHKAAGILRENIAKVKVSKDHYVSCEDLTEEECAKFVPDKLYDFVNWCVNHSDFYMLSSCSDEDVKKENLKVLSICQTIIAQSINAITPLTLAIGISLHHNFGSRQVVEQLSSLGFSVSYDEVRRFLTSAAVQGNDDVYVPKGLLPSSENDSPVDAAIDNFDQNEDTLDGKSTTHSMATVLYKRGDTTVSGEKLKRLTQKVLPVLDECHSQIHRCV